MYLEMGHFYFICKDFLLNFFFQLFNAENHHSMEDFQFFHFYLITFKHYQFFFILHKLIQFMIFTHLLQITSMNDPKAATKEIMKIMHASLINKIKFLGVMPSIIIFKYIKF